MSNLLYDYLLENGLERRIMIDNIRALGHNLKFVNPICIAFSNMERGRGFGDPYVPYTTYGISHRLKKLTRPVGPNVSEKTMQRRRDKLDAMVRAGALEEVADYGSNGSHTRLIRAIKANDAKGGLATRAVLSEMQHVGLALTR